MSRRRGFETTVRRPADGGEPPNQYVPQITVQIRGYWPPGTEAKHVLSALTEAVLNAAGQIKHKTEEIH